MVRALNRGVKRRLLTLAVLVAGYAGALPAATLERLSMDDLIAKSTAIVRGTVSDSWAAFTGPIIYTHYRIQVSETLKGTAQNWVEIAVTGGEVNGIHTSASGSPTLNKGDQYVFFLWTSKAGLTQIMGLTQGLFVMPGDGSADPMITRPPTRELMLDPVTARPVKDAAVSLRLSDLRQRIAKSVAGGKGGDE